MLFCLCILYLLFNVLTHHVLVLTGYDCVGKVFCIHEHMWPSVRTQNIVLRARVGASCVNCELVPRQVHNPILKSL